MEIRSGRPRGGVEERVIAAYLNEQVDPTAFILFVLLGKTEQYDI